MRKQLFGWIFILSLLFNAFVLFGAMVSRKQGNRSITKQDVIRAISDELKLDGKQLSSFTKLRSRAKDETALYRDSITLLRQELADALNQEHPDADQIQDIASREADLHREWRMSSSGRFSEFIDILSPDQRHRMFRYMHRGPPDAGRGPGRDRDRRVLKQFDANHDGLLDASEREIADAFMQEQRAEHEARRQQDMIHRFDADGDGTLSEKEQAAANRAMKSRREGREGFVRQAIIRRFDKDRNHRLDPPEFEAIKKWLQRPGGPKKGRGPRSGSGS